MNIPEEFGNYLLLKKLAEDPLGETFRAGRLGSRGSSRWSCCASSTARGSTASSSAQRSARAPRSQQALKSPNIGTGVDLGQVRSVPLRRLRLHLGQERWRSSPRRRRKRTRRSRSTTRCSSPSASRSALAVAYETRVAGRAA